MYLFFKHLFAFLIAFFPAFALADINDQINATHLLIYQGKYAQAETTYTQLMTPASEEFIWNCVGRYATFLSRNSSIDSTQKSNGSRRH